MPKHKTIAGVRGWQATSKGGKLHYLVGGMPLCGGKIGPRVGAWPAYILLKKCCKNCLATAEKLLIEPRR